jgi:hypothetical protein
MQLRRPREANMAKLESIVRYYAPGRQLVLSYIYQSLFEAGLQEAGLNDGQILERFDPSNVSQLVIAETSHIARARIIKQVAAGLR